MRISGKLAALAAFFVIAIGVAACGSGSSVPGNAVASVAGNPITKQAFNHWMFVAASDQTLQAAQQGQSEPVIVADDPPQFASCIKQVRATIPSLATTKASTLRNDCKQVFTTYNNEVMSFLIEGYWYQADAHKLGIKYTQAQAATDLAKAKKTEFKTAAAFDSYLKQTGETVQDVKFQFLVSKIYAKLISHFSKPVTKAQIASYFTAHASQFGTQESRSVHLLRTKSQASAQAAVAALKAGQSWNAVAKKYAADASAKKDGALLVGVISGEEEHAANLAIFDNPVGKVVGPVKGIFGWYVSDVVKIVPATHESLAKATPTVKQLLDSQVQTNAKNRVTALSKKNWFHRTVCRSTYQVTDCSNYRKPPATTSATPAPSSATATTSSTATGAATTGAATTGASSTAKTSTTKSKG